MLDTSQTPNRLELRLHMARLDEAGECCIYEARYHGCVVKIPAKVKTSKASGSKPSSCHVYFDSQRPSSNVRGNSWPAPRFEIISSFMDRRSTWSHGLIVSKTKKDQEEG